MEITETKKGTSVYGKETICEVHRGIADLLVCRLQDRPEVVQEIMPRLNKAYLMGIKLIKSMIDKKIELPGWEDTHVEEAIELRRERIRLTRKLNEAGISL